MRTLSPEDFEGRIDAMYRLVILASRRAAQLARPETRPLVYTQSRKPTVIALEEIMAGKVTYRTSQDDEEEYVE